MRGKGEHEMYENKLQPRVSGKKENVRHIISKDYTQGMQENVFNPLRYTSSQLSDGVNKKSVIQKKSLIGVCQVGQMVRMMGYNIRKIRAYAANHNNFTPEEWVLDVDATKVGHGSRVKGMANKASVKIAPVVANVGNNISNKLKKGALREGTVWKGESLRITDRGQLPRGQQENIDNLYDECRIDYYSPFLGISEQVSYEHDSNGYGIRYIRHQNNPVNISVTAVGNPRKNRQLPIDQQEQTGIANILGVANNVIPRNKDIYDYIHADRQEKIDGRMQSAGADRGDASSVAIVEAARFSFLRRNIGNLNMSTMIIFKGRRGAKKIALSTLCGNFNNILGVYNETRRGWQRAEGFGWEQYGIKAEKVYEYLTHNAEGLDVNEQDYGSVGNLIVDVESNKATLV